MTIKDLQDLLRNARKTAGLNRVELGKRVGLCPQSIERWEAGLQLKGVASYLTTLEAAGLDIYIRRRDDDD